MQGSGGFGSPLQPKRALSSQQDEVNSPTKAAKADQDSSPGATRFGALGLQDEDEGLPELPFDQGDAELEPGTRRPAWTLRLLRQQLQNPERFGLLGKQYSNLRRQLEWEQQEWEQQGAAAAAGAAFGAAPVPVAAGIMMPAASATGLPAPGLHVLAFSAAAIGGLDADLPSFAARGSAAAAAAPYELPAPAAEFGGSGAGAEAAGGAGSEARAPEAGQVQPAFSLSLAGLVPPTDSEIEQMIADLGDPGELAQQAEQQAGQAAEPPQMQQAAQPAAVPQEQQAAQQAAQPAFSLSLAGLVPPTDSEIEQMIADLGAPGELAQQAEQQYGQPAEPPQEQQAAPPAAVPPPQQAAQQAPELVGGEASGSDGEADSEADSEAAEGEEEDDSEEDEEEQPEPEDESSEEPVDGVEVMEEPGDTEPADSSITKITAANVAAGAAIRAACKR